jgi:hypothetical protein
MAAQFGNALEYTAKRAEKGGVEVPRSDPYHPYTVVVASLRCIWQTNVHAKPFRSVLIKYRENFSINGLEPTRLLPQLINSRFESHASVHRHTSCMHQYHLVQGKNGRGAC